MWTKSNLSVKISFIIISVALLLTPVLAESEDLKIVSFSLSGVSYKFELSEGDCTPTGIDKEIVETCASMDSHNMTHFSIVLCNEMGRDSDFTKWGALKTPKASIGKRIPSRQSLIRDFMKQLKKIDFRELLSDTSKLSEKSFNEVFGAGAKLGGHVEPIDVDEYAGYIGGTLSMSVADEKMVMAAVWAMTIVRGHVFFYYRFKTYQGLSDIIGLLKEVKTDIRRFVVGNQ